MEEEGMAVVVMVVVVVVVMSVCRACTGDSVNV